MRKKANTSPIILLHHISMHKKPMLYNINRQQYKGDCFYLFFRYKLKYIPIKKIGIRVVKRCIDGASWLMEIPKIEITIVNSSGFLRSNIYNKSMQ